MRENFLLCKKMRGAISVIRNESIQSMMVTQFENYQHQMGIHSESELMSLKTKLTNWTAILDEHHFLFMLCHRLGCLLSVGH